MFTKFNCEKKPAMMNSNVFLPLGILFLLNLTCNGEKVCSGTNQRMSVLLNRQHHYQQLRERYTNCTYVDGNLELTWIQDESLDLSFLKDIKEVTGYVLISHAKIKRIILPKLMIIRGRTLFKLNNIKEEFALFVTLSTMDSLEMPNLREILSGSVGFFNNNNLCHIKTIIWDEIISGERYKFINLYNFTQPERECPDCDPSCPHPSCWGEGPENCQIFSKLSCSPQCNHRRCFGLKPTECCHSFCAGGCTGPTTSDCLACHNFNDDNVCKEECPLMRRYNPAIYSWEVNPDGKYAYGATCVKTCPDHLLKDGDNCVRTCPRNKKAEDGECVPCNGPCPKNCRGVEIIHADNIDSFEDCNVIEGSLTILDTSFDGYQEIYPNFTFGPKHSKMHPSKLKVFRTLKEVTGFINIQGSHKDFTNLTCFHNLEIIGGKKLTELSAALYIVKTSLKSLNLHSLKKVTSGIVAILENSDLCFTNSIDWNRITQSSVNNLVSRNANKQTCEENGLVCDSLCSKDGCWGLGPDECVSCASYRLGHTCVEICNILNGFYIAENNDCMPCDKECVGECFGPGPGNCSYCRNVRDGSHCYAECPKLEYNHNGVCMHCHYNCIGGCTGPENTIGERGCNSCEKAIVSGFNPIVIHQCLKVDESCPVGYYLDCISPREAGALKSLIGKSVCRKCHHQCANCTAYGIHVSVCDCLHYSTGEQCIHQCPRDYFTDETTRQCVKCADECRGCYGPTTIECIACRKYRVYIDQNPPIFNCTASCPPDKPYKHFDENSEDPSCIDGPSFIAWYTKWMKAIYL